MGKRSDGLARFAEGKVSGYKAMEEHFRSAQTTYDAQYVLRELRARASDVVQSITTEAQATVAKIEAYMQAARTAQASARTAADERIDWARVHGLTTEIGNRLAQAGTGAMQGERADMAAASQIMTEARAAGDVHRLRALRTAGAGFASVPGGRALVAEFQKDEIAEMGPAYATAVAEEEAATADRYEVDQVISRSIGSAMGMTYETVRGVQQRVGNPTFGEGWA